VPTLTLTTIPILLAFVVPGFVWARAHRYLQASPETTRESWITSFTLSAINYALWFWLIPVLVVRTQVAVEGGTAPEPRVLAGWFVITFAGPALLGVLTGLANRKGWLRTLLIDRLRINIPNPIGTAWDYVFSDVTHERPLWASVTLKDGSIVEGMFAGGSLASSVPGERDLYLEFHAKHAADDSMRPVPDSAGVWLAADEIKAIEFREVQVRSPGSGTEAKHAEPRDA